MTRRLKVCLVVEIMKMLKTQSDKDLHGTLTLPHTPSHTLRLSTWETGVWPKVLKWNMWSIWICATHSQLNMLHPIKSHFFLCTTVNSFEYLTLCSHAYENMKETVERLVMCIYFVSVVCSKFGWSGHQWEAFMNLLLHAHVYMCTHILTHNPTSHS